jgi:hypothetical protein
VRTWASKASTFTMARALSKLETTSAEVVFRHRSLNHCSCSALPPGMNLEVNTCLKVGLSLPHAKRARSTIAR